MIRIITINLNNTCKSSKFAIKIALMNVLTLLFLTIPIHASLQITSLSVNTVLHFGSGTYKLFRSLNKKKTVSSPSRKTKKDLSILQFGFSSIAQTNDDLENIDPEEYTTSSEVEPAVIGKALCYPNPFRLIEGTKLHYNLSKRFNVTIQIYDMLGNKVYDKFFPTGINGAKITNSIKLNTESFNGYSLSAGVYFYLLIHNGKLLTKGKMAIIP